jgi:hypothetical protein
VRSGQLVIKLQITLRAHAWNSRRTWAAIPMLELTFNLALLGSARVET